MAPLTWRHHALIQALLSRGPLKENQFHSLFYQLTGKTPDHKSFNDFLSDINNELSYVQLDLRKCLNQYDGKAYYGVANNVVDEQSKLGTKYTVPQIALYKGIIEAIVQASNGEGSISNTEALNVQMEIKIDNGAGQESQSQVNTQVPTALKNFTITQKDKAIEEFVRDQWLCSISDGQRIGLGVRSFLDLKTWFHNNDVPKCEVCNEYAIKVEFCQNENCQVRIHQSCLKKKFKQARANRVCPKCNTQWQVVTKKEAVEEEDNEEEDNQGDDPPENILPPNPAARKRSRTSRRQQAGDNSELEPEPEPSRSVKAESAQPRRPPRRSARHGAV